MVVGYMGVDPEEVIKELEATQWCHYRFWFLEKVYTHNLHKVELVSGVDEQVVQHRAYALREYLFYFVGASIFVDENSTYMDVIYMRYFDNFKQIHEYN